MNVSKGDAVTYVALVTSAVLQAAEPLRKEAAVPADLHPILSSQLWAYAPLALLLLVGVIWLVRQIRPSRAVPQPILAPTAEPAVSGKKAAPNSYLKESHVYAGAPGIPDASPSVSVCFGRSGKDAEICIDFSYFVGALNFAGWIKRRRLLLKEIKSFRRDEEMRLPIMVRDTVPESQSLGWRWGDAQIKYTNKIEGILRQASHYRCRIAFIFADGTEEYIYFLVETVQSTDPIPLAIESRAFDFIAEWECE
jgi:hypothetical protein